MKKITMYSKTECCLCDNAMAILEELQRELAKELAFEIDEVDIYQDDELLLKYQIMIPVIEIDGEEVESGIIHKNVIRNRLLQK